MKLPELKELPTVEVMEALKLENEQLKAQVEQLLPLARRCLWGAYVWNDHNFDHLQEYCKKEALEVGFKNKKEANLFLEITPAQCLAEVKAQAIEDAATLAGEYGHARAVRRRYFNQRRSLARLQNCCARSQVRQAAKGGE